MPKVSVIMPAYNVENYIGDSIQSVLDQIFADFELIIIDDGSTDGTLAVVNYYAGKDRRIRVFQQENKGVAAARNLGINQANGKFVSFLDSDDLWLPEFLDKLMKRQKSSNMLMVACGHNDLLSGGEIEQYSGNYCSGNVLYNYIAFELHLERFDKMALDLHIGSYLIDSSLLKKYSIFFIEGCRYGEDTEFEYKVMSVAHIAMVEENLTLYRKRSGSMTKLPWNFESALMEVESRERAIAFVQKHCSYENRREILSILQMAMDRKRLIALWRSVKFNLCDNRIEELIIDWEESLIRIRNNSLFDSSKRLKAAIILSKKRSVWRVINYFGSK